MAQGCVLLLFLAASALAAPSHTRELHGELSQEPRAGWLHKARAWLCSRHPQHRWCEHWGQQEKETRPSQSEQTVLTSTGATCGGDCRKDTDCPNYCHYCHAGVLVQCTPLDPLCTCRSY
jgi:hypothetical protein